MCPYAGTHVRTHTHTSTRPRARPHTHLQLAAVELQQPAVREEQRAPHERGVQRLVARKPLGLQRAPVVGCLAHERHIRVRHPPGGAHGAGLHG